LLKRPDSIRVVVHANNLVANGSEAGAADQAYVTTTDDANLQWLKPYALA